MLIHGSRWSTLLDSFNHQSSFQSVESCQCSGTAMSMLHQKAQATESKDKYIKYIILPKIDPITVEGLPKNFFYEREN